MSGGIGLMPIALGMRRNGWLCDPRRRNRDLASEHQGEIETHLRRIDLVPKGGNTPEGRRVTEPPSNSASRDVSGS